MTALEIVMLGADLKQNGGIATLENLMIKYAPSDIRIHHITSHAEGSIPYRILVFTQAWIVLIHRLLLKPIDIVHIHISDGGSVIRKALLALTGFIFHKPVIMHANGAEFHVTYSKLPLWVQAPIASIFRRCDAFIAVTRLWQDYYISTLRLHEKRVTLLPNPTELPDHIPDRTHSDQIKIAYCGRIGQRKGTFDLIQAFARLPKELQQRTHLVLAGDGDLDRARQLIEHLELTEWISTPGWITAKQRDALLAEADLFILPSYNEGLPLALMEAMGWGLPVITTPVSGIPDMVTSGKNGLLVPPGNISQLSQAMQSLIQDEALRLQFGRAARDTVAPWDIRPFYHHLMCIYHSIL